MERRAGAVAVDVAARGEAARGALGSAAGAGAGFGVSVGGSLSGDVLYHDAAVSVRVYSCADGEGR